jgi:cyclic pyranopterin phosphate synthase
LFVYSANFLVVCCICDNSAAKGAVLPVCEIAGVMAAKRTADLIPMCHPLGAIDDISVEARYEKLTAPGG